MWVIDEITPHSYSNSIRFFFLLGTDFGNDSSIGGFFVFWYGRVGDEFNAVRVLDSTFETLGKSAHFITEGCCPTLSYDGIIMFN